MIIDHCCPIDQLIQKFTLSAVKLLFPFGCFDITLFDRAVESLYDRKLLFDVVGRVADCDF